MSVIRKLLRSLFPEKARPGTEETGVPSASVSERGPAGQEAESRVLAPRGKREIEENSVTKLPPQTVEDQRSGGAGMVLKKSDKVATALHPKICILVIDESGSMAEEGKCQQVTEAVQDLVITMQSLNQGTHGYRFLLNICKFGDTIVELALAKSPTEVDVDKLVFEGALGGTDMQPALRWAETALKKSLERCRSIPNYQEDLAPNPICVFLSDGECTGDDPTAAAKALRTISFKNGEVDVCAVGVGMHDEHFEVMKAISSKPEFAIPIGAEGIAEFLGEIGSTFVDNRGSIMDVAAKAKRR
jgi:uncharacterized protein YegL